MNSPFSFLAAAAVAALTFAACESPRARIMADTDQDFVGDRTAGAGTFDRLISEGVEKLLTDHSAAQGGLGKLSIVSLPVENESAEELGDWQEQIYSLLTTSVNRSERYNMISRRFVEAALRETRLRPDQLFLPQYQRQLLEVLEQQGLPVDAMLFPKLTSGTTDAGRGITQRNYGFELALVDVKSGQERMYTTRLRKEYRGQ
ncbi:MAG: penicillin-binding protein activator LpoB [Planctomycetota bacterium]